MNVQKKLVEEPEEGVEGRRDPRNALNDLTGKEWIQLTNTIWFQHGLGKDHPETFYERQHPAPFAYLMIEKLLKFFTKRGGQVLDPFCGVGSTLKAAELNGRKATGIELSRYWFDLARQRLDAEAKGGPNQKLIQGDARTEINQFSADYFDFVVTSPPYWGILNKPADHRVKEERVKENLATRYSQDSNDLANISDYGEFLRELQHVWEECHRVLKPNKYAAVVVADFRHKSRYIAFHSDIAKSMEEVGFASKGIIIFVKNAKKLYPYGYPFEYVPNIHHEYIMVFKKGNGNGTSNPG